MAKRKTFVLTRFLITIAVVVITGPLATAEQALTPYAQLPKATQQRISTAANASFHFHLDQGVDCTGTYISSTGHFITALHCVAGCLAKKKAIVKELAVDEPTARIAVGLNPLTGVLKVKNLYTHKMTVNEDKIDAGLTCSGTIGHDRRADMKLVLTGGKGWLAPKETLAGFSRKFPEEYRALLDNGYEHGADFAILQVNDLKGNACLPLGRAASQAASELHAIPYACVSRDAHLKADGQTALYTSGKRTSGIRDSDYFRKVGAAKLPFDPKTVDRNETFFSTLDMEKCGSGTGIFDSSLSLVGVATRVYKVSTDYERGSLESIDVAQVWRELLDKKSGSDIKEITSCRLPATQPPPVQLARRKAPASAEHRPRRSNPVRS